MEVLNHAPGSSDPPDGRVQTKVVSQALREISSMVAEALHADRCTITLLDERRAANIGLRCTAAFGQVLPEMAQHEDIESCDQMFCAIPLHGKIIGVIHAYACPQARTFTAPDLRSLHVLANLVGRAVGAIELQKILASRLTQIALATPKRNDVTGIETEAAQHPREIARITAKAFYQELLNAGFDFNQITCAASEIVSELSRSLRARGK